jgi:uncharacterized protein
MKRLWWVGAAFALLLSYPLFLESRWIETSRTRIAIPELRAPVRVLLLTDLHLGDGADIAKLEMVARRAVAEARPQLICLTGDYVASHRALRWPLENVIRILAQAAPVYAVMGNHDGGLWAEREQGDASNGPVRERLERGGAAVLHNRWTVAEVAGQRVLLVGTGDLWSHEVDAAQAFDGAPAGLPTLVLTHNPDTKDLLQDRPWHLMLAGHTHGNQVNLPFWDEPWATVRDKRYISGRGDWRGRQIYVSRGIAGLAGIRFRARPEISILEIVPRI